jgi:hypothetical protein
MALFITGQMVRTLVPALLIIGNKAFNCQVPVASCAINPPANIKFLNTIGKRNRNMFSFAGYFIGWCN